MEVTHMVQSEKIEKLLFALAIALCWVQKRGEIQPRRGRVVLKKHGRRTKSIFRIGLDLIRRALFMAIEVSNEGLSLLPYLEGVVPGG